MKRTGIAVISLMTALLCFHPSMVRAQDDVKAEIQQIKQQLTEMDALKAKLADLEKRLDETRKAQESSNPTVTTAFKGAKVKVDGRIFVGTFKSQSGDYAKWGTNISDAKLRFTFNPWKKITIVNRFSTSGAKNGDFDYFYLDYAGLPNATSVLRLGQRKIDFGQETWTDNPIENILVSNSVSHTSGYGIGMAFNGKLGGAGNAPVYEIGVVNGTKLQTTRATSGVQTNVKIGVPFADNLFASANSFRTGKLLATDKSAMAIAQISDAPSGTTTDWRRSIWELDLRYNYGSKGILSAIPSGKPPKVAVGATWGKWSDDTTGASDRDGNYWFAEGLCNLTPKFYTAARYSRVKLDSGVLAKLAKSPVAVNEYNRTSIGLGYRLNDLTDVKAEYSINSTSGGASDPGLNQWAFGVATKF